MKKNIHLGFALFILAIVAALLAGCGPTQMALPASDGFNSGPLPADIAQPGPQVVPQNAPQGSVRGICGDFTIVQPNNYSVCGFAVLKTSRVDEKVKIAVHLPTEEEIPGGVGNLLVGYVRIDWYVDNVLEQGPNSQADVDICFNSSKENVTVRYYDDNAQTWNDLATTVADGEACAKMEFTGFYALAEK